MGLKEKGITSLSPTYCGKSIHIIVKTQKTSLEMNFLSTHRHGHFSNQYIIQGEKNCKFVSCTKVVRENNVNVILLFYKMAETTFFSFPRGFFTHYF